MAVALGCPVALSSPISGQIVINRLFRSVSLLLAACFIASCSDSLLQSPTSPIDPATTAARASDRTGGIAGALPDAGIELKALWWTRDGEGQIVTKVTQTIDPSGGVIV